MPVITEDNAKDLLWTLQLGLPLTREPFATIASELSLPEDSLLSQIEEWKLDGTIRRFGGVFDARSLGYTSSLLATTARGEARERMIDVLRRHSGITHAYEREDISGHPIPLTLNQWFTLTAPRATFDQELRQLQAALHPLEIINLPSIHRFKVQVLFRTGSQNQPSAAAATPEHPPLSDQEVELVRHLQGDIPLHPRPFDAISQQCGIPPGDILSRLDRWKHSGRLRRIAAILHHRRIGYAANGMATWSVPTEEIISRGTMLAERPDISHCYARAPHSQMPDALYAMLHAHSHDDLRACQQACEAATGLTDGHLLLSTHEWKKTSPCFFSDNPTPP